MSNENFYKAFEDKYRGSREAIKERAEVYLPFLEPLQKIYSDGVVLDIGSGRGEWLELLKTKHIQTEGIDSDSDMVAFCKSLNLNVNYGDGIQYLQEQPDEKYLAITAFHVVEHISLSQLQLLIQESLRLLKPGGLLILETPNPENIKVATENFYIDPTHIKPIPSALLSFLPEFYDYKRTKVIKLQEHEHLHSKEDITIQEIFDGVSQDYAVVAQKSAEENILNRLNPQFSKEYGISLIELTAKFENRLRKIEQRVIEVEKNYTRLLNSTSWKVTKPLRFTGDKIKFLKKKWNQFSLKSSLKDFILSNPKLAKGVFLIIKYHFRFKKRSHQNIQNEENLHHYPKTFNRSSLHAQKIYHDLKSTIDSLNG